MVRKTISLCAAIALGGCSSGGGHWHGTDVTGAVPALSLDMDRAATGATLTAQQFRGTVTALYFGYTSCPDICPMTLSNMGKAIGEMGGAAKDVRVLFVSVDPKRDTPQQIASYVGAFGPQFVGLAGTPNQIARLAKRYRVAYSVAPDPDPSKYEVTHSSALYVFDKHGEARLLENSLSTDKPQTDAVAADLKRLVAEKD